MVYCRIRTDIGMRSTCNTSSRVTKYGMRGITVDGAEVLMKHIGGYPGKYDPSVQGSILVRPPKLFVSGHSHILKVKFDKTLGMLHINPGAAGIYGFHKVRTMVRFVIDGGVFKDLEVIELAG